MKKKRSTDSDGRHAYMLAWRDRMIEKQKQIIQGQGEQLALLESLLALALTRAARAADAENGVREIAIPKAELAAELGRWESAVRDGGTCYTVTFTRRANVPDGKDEARGAQ
ncbi:MAG: hypothetical protein IJA78_06750 [Clostridia bacterium]|nr:hypothetical protein [Clostridia bacterium]